MNYKDETLFNVSEVKNPSEKFYPIYSWVWNSPITKEVIIEQIDTMVRDGIYGMYIIPEPPEFRPTSMVTYMTPEYLSPEFFDLVKFTVNYAKSKNMNVWLYDEGGWPSGAACGKVIEHCPDCRSEIIVENEVKLKKGEKYQTSSECLCAFTEEYVRIRSEYTAINDCVIYEYCKKKENVHLPCLLKKEAVDTFINLTYEGYKKTFGEELGNVCPAIFTDEAILHYPYVILDETDFKDKTGFDLCEYLPAVFHNEAFGSDGEKFRIAYVEYSGNEFAKSYMEPIKEWCEKNKIMLAGHMDGDHTLSDYTRNVGNILKQLRYMDIPGVDVIWNQIYPGNGKDMLFPRMASSAASMMGKYYALTESFAVYGCGMTYDVMRYIINAQEVRGINIINIMSMSSGTDGFICHQFRPNFLLESPVTKFLKNFNEYIARISYMCSVGKPCRKAAVYLPLRDIWSQHPESKEVQESFYTLCRQLDENYVDFDIIDDDFISCAEQNDGKLCKGIAEYSTVYIPLCKYMPEHISEKLAVYIRPLLTIHDEILFEVPKDKVSETCRFIQSCMEQKPFLEFDIPLKAEGAVGFSFGDMEEL